MVGTSKIDKTEKVGITLPISILKRVDKVRADIPRPRSMFIRRAIEQSLRKEGK
jgi:metal-responsive CopG/Arc/MetJ family transcriptional regulator